jgi:hypothetical protein
LIASCEVGVLSNDENAEPAVGSAGVGSVYADPACVIPEVGQVSEYGAKCSQYRLVWLVSHTPRAGFHVAIGCCAE